jgi:predicted transcriptional regulator
MSNNILLLSVRPKYADKIFKHTKTVELRRVRPKHLQKGDLVLIYVSSPIQALAGTFKVERVVEEPLKNLWQLVKKKAGVTRQEFNTYYEGVSTGVGIFFEEVQRFQEPIALQTIRQHLLLFQPPQSFRYASDSELVLPPLANLIAEVKTSNSLFPLPL